MSYTIVEQIGCTLPAGDDLPMPQEQLRVVIRAIDELKKTHLNSKRSLLFAFFTGEEEGLLGSTYFVDHLTVERKAIVANLNFDTIHAIVPLKAVRVIGLNESTLGDSALQAAASENVSGESEQDLNAGAFTCCGDHYSFVKSGISSVAIKVGFPPDLAPVLYKFRRERYHTPADNLQQPINFETARKFEEIMYRLVLDVADNPQRPQWKSDSFYRRYASR